MAELYRHFDAGNQLLYVGISLSAVSRMQSHKALSHWSNSIAKVTIEKYETRSGAELAGFHWSG